MAITNARITPCDPATFIPLIWTPDDKPGQPEAHAASQYMIRELADGIVIWRRDEGAHHAAPHPYVATHVPNIVAVQANRLWRQEHTDVLWAALDSPIARLRTPGDGGTMVFDTLDDLRARLAWGEQRMRYWRTAERLRGEALRAQARLAHEAWREEQERLPPERRTFDFSALDGLHPDDEGC